MGSVKHYLNNVICACSEQKFGQDAIAWEIGVGHVPLTMDMAADTARVTSEYDSILEAYRVEVIRNEAMLVESYAPLMAAIQPPIQHSALSTLHSSKDIPSPECECSHCQNYHDLPTHEPEDYEDAA